MKYTVWPWRTTEKWNTAVLSCQAVDGEIEDISQNSICKLDRNTIRCQHDPSALIKLKCFIHQLQIPVQHSLATQEFLSHPTIPKSPIHLRCEVHIIPPLPSAHTTPNRKTRSSDPITCLFTTLDLQLDTKYQQQPNPYIQITTIRPWNNKILSIVRHEKIYKTKACSRQHLITSLTPHLSSNKSIPSLTHPRNSNTHSG